MLENTTRKDLNKTLWVKKDIIESERKWLVIDAKGQTLGKLAVEIANRLIGKWKSYYNDFWDAGDYVIVENVTDIVLTGNKKNKKVYYTHSWHKGHLKTITFEKMHREKPEEVINLAVRWMLPKNKLRAVRMKRLKVFVGTTDKYNDLSPEKIEING